MRMEQVTVICQNRGNKESIQITEPSVNAPRSYVPPDFRSQKRTVSDNGELCGRFAGCQMTQKLSPIRSASCALCRCVLWNIAVLLDMRKMLDPASRKQESRGFFGPAESRTSDYSGIHVESGSSQAAMEFGTIVFGHAASHG